MEALTTGFGLWGLVGFGLVDLALVAAALATGALTAASVLPESQRAPWRRMGFMAFAVHAGAVVATFGLLLTLLLTHQFAYHYVWSHSSHELPVHYVLACLWEGQEGSFLTWLLWQALLGLVVWRTAPKAWLVPTLAVMAAVQTLLASMVLGAWIPRAVVQGLLTLTLLSLAAALRPRRGISDRERFWRVALVALALPALANLWAGVADAGTWAHRLQALLLGVITAAWAFELVRRGPLTRPLGPLALAWALLAVVWALYLWPVGGWQVGSSPFMLLREAMPDQSVFAENAQFVPPNGRGLNPLLQNYWMVIHPPTLFLGFALCLVPFAFGMGGLLTGDLTGWLRPAAPWMVASMAVLGVGILMGGYWAYETLNFGGYWNWDPVENASLVPWLTGLAALHLAVAYRHRAGQLRPALVLVIVTFWLVLYSTFLTRSGVLGDASVHSFTDLGLSGQLLLLLLLFVLAGLMLLFYRWGEFEPAGSVRELPFFSRETFFALAAIVLAFAALQIGLSTSLPVFNKLFGTALAPAGAITYYYYQWNVWVAILIAGLSAVGQFLFWRSGSGKDWSGSLFRPFAVGALSAIVVMILLAWARWPFVYETQFAQAESINWFARGSTFVLRLADELLLFASLVSVFANADILIGLVRRGGRALQSTGGALAHLGFALMLLGILFSSGYEQTLTINFTPGELGPQFPERERLDNVLLQPHQPKYIRQYRVVYRGKTRAEAPIVDLDVLFEDASGLKLAFADATGERYGMTLPAQAFELEQFIREGIVRPTNGQQMPLAARLDLDKLKLFIDLNLDLIKPQLLNGRKLYVLEFAPLDAEAKQADTLGSFTLLPEAEVSTNMGLVLHPDRRVGLTEDLYVYVSSIPAAEAEAEASGESMPDTTTRRMRIREWRAATGDTLSISRGSVILDSLVRVTDDPRFAATGAQFVVRAKLRILAGGRSFSAAPNFLLLPDGTVQHADDRIEALGLQFAFAGISPTENRVVIQVGEEENPADFITIKAIRKPWINLLWLGTVVLTFGFAVAIVRRTREARTATSSEAGDD